MSRQNGNGLRRLVNKYRNEFRRPENTEYYSEEDYRQAERKFVRHCLSGDLFDSPSVSR